MILLMDMHHVSFVEKHATLLLFIVTFKFQYDLIKNGYEEICFFPGTGTFRNRMC